MKHFKHLFLTSLALIGLLVASTAASSATIPEYQILQDLAKKYPDQTAKDPNQCNTITINKSPLNKRSLNPMCQICVGAQEDGLNSTYISLSIKTINPDDESNDAFNACFADPNQQFSTSFTTDYSSLCASRGGVYSTLNGASLCLFTTQ